MIAPTATRVSDHTADAVNDRIYRQTVCNVRGFENASKPQIDKRLRELDAEWDIERTLEANAATACLVGTVLGMTVNRKFLLLPAVVSAFLLQHAVQGWCPPMVLLRRMGIRTEAEIELERDALRAIRGDFKDLPVRRGDAVDAPPTVDRLYERSRTNGDA